MKVSCQSLFPKDYNFIRWLLTWFLRTVSVLLRYDPFTCITIFAAVKCEQSKMALELDYEGQKKKSGGKLTGLELQVSHYSDLAGQLPKAKSEVEKLRNKEEVLVEQITKLGRVLEEVRLAGMVGAELEIIKKVFASLLGTLLTLC